MNLMESVLILSSTALLFGILYINSDNSHGSKTLRLSKAVGICKQHINSNIEYRILPTGPSYKEGWQETCGELAEIIANQTLAKITSKHDETDRAFLKSVIDDIK